MGQNRATVDIHLVGDGHVVSENSDVLQTCPAANGAVPANNGGLDPSVVLDLAVLHHDAALETDTIANDDVGTNNNIGTNTAVLADLGGGVNHDISTVHVGLCVGGKHLGLALGQGSQVQASTGEEILGLADIHPEALEIEGVELALLTDGGEGLLFDGGRAKLNALENTGVQNVDTGVDAVANEFDGFLDEAVDAGGMVGLVDDDTVLGGLVDLGDDDGALFTVAFVEVGELLEGVVANNIRVEDEERRVILAQDLLRQLERASRAQRFGLDGELNVDSVLLLVLLEGCDHHIRAVVDGKNDISNTRSSQALDLVQDHGPVSELHQRLGKSEGLEQFSISIVQ